MSLTRAEAAAIELKPCKEPRYEQFEQPGAKVFGVLTSVAKGQITDKQTKKKKEIIRYTVQEPEGEKVNFIGTCKIDLMISPLDKGKLISIEFTGKQSTPNGEMKVFAVGKSEGFISSARDAAFDEITDDDIPF
jgi:hypothetical protein